jgi:hypothetical protein
MSFICNKCGNEYKTKYNLDRHLAKKAKPCITPTIVKQMHTPILTQNAFYKNITRCGGLENSVKKCVSGAHTNSTQTPHKNELICKYCNKEFSRVDSLERHMTKYCKMLLELKDNKINEITKEKDQILNELKDKQLNEIIKEKDHILNEFNNKIKEATEQIKECVQNKIDLNGIPDIITDDSKNIIDKRNKYHYKLLEVDKYEEPDLSKLTISEILNIIGDSTNVLDADKKILEAFYLKSGTGKISNMRLADVSRNKMLLASDDNKWKKKEAMKECETVLENIGSICYTKLCEYYNEKMKEYDIDTDEELEKIMQTSEDPKYKSLWNIHMITNGHFLRNHIFTRSHNVATYIHEYQLPQLVFSKNNYLYIKEQKSNILPITNMNLI